jgi:hypothetical protein
MRRRFRLDDYLLVLALIALAIVLFYFMATYW